MPKALLDGARFVTSFVISKTRRPNGPIIDANRKTPDRTILSGANHTWPAFQPWLFD